VPSPLGHEIAGILIYDVMGKLLDIKKRAKILFLCLLMALLPDFDFIFGILEGEPNKYHHGLSHSVFVGLLVSILFAALFFYQDKLWVFIVLFFSVYVSHLVLDLLSLDRSFPYGLKFLWPLTNEFYISPKYIFSDIIRGKRNTDFFQNLIFNKHNYLAVAREIIILSPPLIVVRLYSRWRRLNG
jgi:membrane-bound metal-dependent hydrolase YbcI (DUF457 family)